MSISTLNIGDEIESWFNSKHFKNVDFSRDKRPAEDLHESYRVTEDFFFLPADRKALVVNLFITEDLEVGLSLDTRVRLAEVFGLKPSRSHAKRNAGGFEPFSVPLPAITLLLDLISSGKLSINYTNIPYLFWETSSAAIPSDEISSLVKLGFSNADQIFQEPRSSGWGIRNLKFENWT